ncbi:molybdopterin molybdotransferase MoeA [Acinetobacter calcoaceticus]|uniref:Molybdopterin molybdenumtransferase n=1 Tax=Acinetobacter calcoaceticus TaxID=471 RepID=A0A446ZID0_ACICA|nr:molybdopterin molybdotransferase MoeA [Acinetobacter calcoaceticus]VAX44274.1 Molybdopterin molybdenumtransferase [Acinetobacter calcoaceticus]
MSGCGTERGLISVDEALELIIKQPKKLGSINQVLQNSLSRYLAKEIYSEINLPSFSQSAVDGYALCSHAEDLQQQKFQVTGEIRAGSESHDTLKEGQAIRIFTGGKIPEGTTHVARQEVVSVLAAQEICLTEHIRPQADIRFTGEEIQKGQLLAQIGQFLNIGSLAALSMAGVRKVKIYRAPKVVVLVTGDEVAETAEDLIDGKIFDANGPLLKAWFEDYGLDVELIHVADEAEQVMHYFNQCKDSHDVIITTGGVSVGDYDFVRPCAFEVGFEQIFWKVKQKPGKPLFFAEYSQPERGHHCYLLGLPGNPAAVYVAMQIYGKALLDSLQGNQAGPEWFSAILEHDLKEDARERFLRMYAYFENGQLKIKSLAKQQSHMLSNLMQANCLVRIPAGVKLEAGYILKGIFISN